MENIELSDLRWAIAVSHHRSLRQAAQTLNIRQSTLSRRLRDIEYRLGTSLFERTNGGTRPTTIGLEFLAIARRILNESDTAFRRLKSRSRGEQGRVSIGVYASLTAGNMHATLSEHHRRFPEVHVHTLDGTHDKLLGALVDKSIDVAIMTTVHSTWNSRTLPLWSERVIAAFPKHHPFNERGTVRWSDLRNERLILPIDGPGPELERLLNAKLHDTDPRHILHQDSGLDRLLSLVSAEHGTLLLLEGGTGARYDGVVYREVYDDDGPTRLNFATYWREENDNPTLQRFLDMLRERYPDLSATPGAV